jgi:hypothetical protein
MFSIDDPWAPLTDVMVGTCRTSLEWVEDSNIRNQLLTIVRETQDDLDDLATWLTNRGITVYRPQCDSNFNHRPIVSPRDHILVIDDRIFVDQANFPEFNAIKLPTVNASSIHHFGDKICLSRDVDLTVLEHFSDYQIVRFYQPGHIDGWFTIPCPGLIISSRDYQRPDLLTLFYKKNFNDYEVVYVNETSTKPNWNVYRNTPTLEFLNQYLESWVGNPDETVFELNMLIIDKNNIVTNCIDDTVAAALQRYNVTAHIVPFRHAPFWDCGIHCATADLSRKKAESLSPRPPAQF